MLSPFGKIVRKLRIDKGITLKTMADDLNRTSAYLSAVETGRKNTPEKLVREIAAYFELSDEDTNELFKAADASRSEVRMPLKDFNDTQREIATAFARQFSALSEEELEQIRNLLNKMDPI